MMVHAALLAGETLSEMVLSVLSLRSRMVRSDRAWPAPPRAFSRGGLAKKRRGDGPHGRPRIIGVLPSGSSSVRIVPGKFDRSPAPSSPASWHTVCVVMKQVQRRGFEVKEVDHE